MAVRVKPLTALVILTMTACITPPVGSLTVPSSVPAPPRPWAETDDDPKIPTHAPITPRPTARRRIQNTTTTSLGVRTGADPRTENKDRKLEEGGGGWSAGRCGRIEDAAGENDVGSANRRDAHAAGNGCVNGDKARAQRAQGMADDTVVVWRCDRNMTRLEPMRVVIVVDEDRIAGGIIPPGVTEASGADTHDRREK